MKGKEEHNGVKGVRFVLRAQRNYSIERDGTPTLSCNCANSIEYEVPVEHQWVPARNPSRFEPTKRPIKEGRNTGAFAEWAGGLTRNWGTKRNGSTERTGRDKDAFYVAENSTEMSFAGAPRSVVIIVNAIPRLPFRSCNALERSCSLHPAIQVIPGVPEPPS